jgi:predicted CXXCH cytochrome family protein
MKQFFLVLIVILVMSVISYGQLKQILPTMPGGTQGTRAAMLKGPHDFTPDSGAVNTFGTDSLGNPVAHPTGSTKSLCSYCHSPHVPKDAIASPLWARKSLVGSGRTWGYYQDVNTIPDGVVTDPVGTDNYSAFCLGCHDGSTGILAATAYDAVPFGLTGGTNTKVAYSTNVVNGEFDLQHVHPVNFNYVSLQATSPQELYPAVDNSKVWQGDNGSGSVTTVRLFNGYMQCSSCHNPHMNSGIGVVYSSSYGKLCVTCHKK